MNKKIVSVLLACAAVFALCIAMAGCGGDNKKDFVGNWELTEIQDGSGTATTSSDDVAKLKDMGLTVTLTLAEDGKATLSMFGEEQTGTWKVDKAKEATIEIEGLGSQKITVEKDSLTMANSDARLLFVKTNQA